MTYNIQIAVGKSQDEQIDIAQRHGLELIVFEFDYDGDETTIIVRAPTFGGAFRVTQALRPGLPWDRFRHLAETSEVK